MDAPRQALVPDLPHLEQKSPLQNLGDLAGGTALQSVLVTPSGEQPAPALGGPLPCKDRPPTIIINTTGEDDREEQEREEIVRPESESSSSGSPLRVPMVKEAFSLPLLTEDSEVCLEEKMRTL